ncbi:hypothetical protein B0I35DRAFT_436593 [Stachybotrys elegans]|uniref:Uncharacterized protein n=1 Tax=Stachybotrys elegans TaxID=80388 RepID=A0A8K0WNI0_9HYPO|nr:hypothetical protein B0I35DRAFT_436593 [Stachybotrys elegans]
MLEIPIRAKSRLLPAPRNAPRNQSRQLPLLLSPCQGIRTSLPRVMPVDAPKSTSRNQPELSLEILYSLNPPIPASKQIALSKNQKKAHSRTPLRPLKPPSLRKTIHDCLMHLGQAHMRPSKDACTWSYPLPNICGRRRSWEAEFRQLRTEVQELGVQQEEVLAAVQHALVDIIGLCLSYDRGYHWVQQGQDVDGRVRRFILNAFSQLASQEEQNQMVLDLLSVMSGGRRIVTEIVTPRDERNPDTGDDSSPHTDT